MNRLNRKNTLKLVLVTGGRDYDDTNAVKECLLYLEKTLGGRMIVVHGDADGADNLAYKICKEAGIEQARIPAAWKKYGRSAGPVRNGLMLRLFDVDLVLAFPGGTGTENMKEQARQKSISVIESDDLLKIISEGES